MLLCPFKQGDSERLCDLRSCALWVDDDRVREGGVCCLKSLVEIEVTLSDLIEDKPLSDLTEAIADFNTTYEENSRKSAQYLGGELDEIRTILSNRSQRS